MEDNKEIKEIKELERKVTEGGYEYIEIENLKIRNSIRPERLIEDNETYEEYKVRQRYSKEFCENRAKAVWYSQLWGPCNADNRWKVYQQMLKLAEKETKKEENNNDTRNESLGNNVPNQD